MSREQVEYKQRTKRRNKTMETSSKKNQAAIVTGASSGMGLAITQALLEHGYGVVANSRNISKSKDLKPSSNLVLVGGDIGKKDVADEMDQDDLQKFFLTLLLFNTHGTFTPT